MNISFYVKFKCAKAERLYARKKKENYEGGSHNFAFCNYMVVESGINFINF